MTKLQEQLKRFKELALLEATSASSSGSYEEPMAFDVEEKVEDFIGLRIADEAPEIKVVDMTAQAPTEEETQNGVNVDADIDELEFDLEGSDIDVDVHLTPSDKMGC